MKNHTKVGHSSFQGPVLPADRCKASSVYVCECIFSILSFTPAPIAVQPTLAGTPAAESRRNKPIKPCCSCRRTHLQFQSSDFYGDRTGGGVGRALEEARWRINCLGHGTEPKTKRTTAMGVSEHQALWRNTTKLSRLRVSLPQTAWTEESLV